MWVVPFSRDLLFIAGALCWAEDLVISFGGSNRGVWLFVDTWVKKGPLRCFSAVSAQLPRLRWERKTHSAAREDGDAFRANQISSISPGSQWGDRWHNQNSFRVSTDLREDGASVWYQTVKTWNGSPGLGPHQCSNQDRAGSGSDSRSYCLSVPQKKVGPWCLRLRGD